MGGAFKDASAIMKSFLALLTTFGILGATLTGKGESSILNQLQHQCGAVYPIDGAGEGNRHLTGFHLFNADASAFYGLSNAKRIEVLEFEATDLNVPAFREIGNLTPLKYLKAVNCWLLPAQLTALQDLTHLEHLDLMFSIFKESNETRKEMLGALSPAERKSYNDLKNEGTGEHVILAALLTDRIMPTLGHLTKLKTLRLINTFVTADGLKQLTPLEELEVLEINFLGISREDTKPFQSMKHLRSLSLITADDSIVETLSHISGLEHLNIWCDKVTEKGAANLATLKNLNRLEIRGNNMSDQGLLILGQLPNLKFLDISHANAISRRGVTQFQTLHPNVKIVGR